MGSIQINHDIQGKSFAIKLAAGQRVYQVHREKESINFDMNKYVLSYLSANAYILYMYMITNAQNRPWSLSSKHINDMTPLSKNTYPNAFNELVEKGFLTEGIIDIGGQVFKKDAYHLWEYPELKDKTMPTLKSGK